MCLAVEINMLNYTVIRCVRGHYCVKFTTLRQELQKIKPRGPFDLK